MKVLVVGDGGREHALAWKLAQSPQVSEVICRRGNPGMEAVGRCVGQRGEGIEELAAWAERERVDLTVVGPEAYLELGIVDAFSARGLLAVGPTREAARIESSKVFAKELMVRAGVPTARFEVCETPERARRAVRAMGAPVVVKADGLAAGKGVTVARSIDEADRAIDRIMTERLFGEAGARVVVEECLTGEEASLLAFVDGSTFLTMPAAQDHKPIGEGDTGPNTGGMGAYAPAPVVTEAVLREARERIFAPIIAQMAKEGRPYRGILYAGLMITDEGPRVIEFNCRFGDPETQALLPLLASDLVEPLLATVQGGLDRVRLTWRTGAAVNVVLASAGYPGAYQVGFPITGLDEVERLPDVLVFHSGTRRGGEGLVTDGGRVLSVTARGADILAATKRAYEAVAKIQFEGVYYRRDIAAKSRGRSASGVT